MRIEGLTQHQVELLDTMWAIDEFEDMEEWMATLCRADRMEAQRLQQLVVLETFEDLLAKDGYPDAVMVIDKIRKL
jgi:hypothetical protein